jgi:hypothetical protein
MVSMNYANIPNSQFSALIQTDVSKEILENVQNILSVEHLIFPIADVDKNKVRLNVKFMFKEVRSLYTSDKRRQRDSS